MVLSLIVYFNFVGLFIILILHLIRVGWNLTVSSNCDADAEPICEMSDLPQDTSEKGVEEESEEVQFIAEIKNAPPPPPKKVFLLNTNWKIERIGEGNSVPLSMSRSGSVERNAGTVGVDPDPDTSRMDQQEQAIQFVGEVVRDFIKIICHYQN